MASLGDMKQKLQWNGYVEAFRSPEVQKAITSGPYGRIAVTYVEWSSAFYQHIVVPWRVIANDEDALSFADELARVPITLDSMTSISGALRYALGVFDSPQLVGDRRTINVSGDGPNNAGSSLLPIREQVLRQGITINGLPIILDPTAVYGGSLADYYQDCVIGGPGAFILTVTALDQFATATKRKLVLEIASASALSVVPVAEVVTARPKMDCVLAEQYRPGRDFTP
jgi:hypothetical protein